MGVDQYLAHLSDTLLFFAVLAYTFAMLGFAAEFSFSRRAGVARALARSDVATEAVAVRSPALVGVSGGGTEPAVSAPRRAGGGGDGDTLGDRLGKLAIGLTVVGWLLHIGSVTTRGLAEHRVPWGNMYEFSSMVTLVAVTGFLVLLTRERVRYLGAFVLLPVVLFLGIAGTVLYVPAGPLIPALQSYWIKIHVLAAIIASGAFMVGAVVTALYLIRARFDRLVAAGREPRFSAPGRLLPPASSLDRIAYRVHAFAFPVWTFAIIAGAIWAESAWGRYWGWDPKETWSFITWVIYAGYLHARTTVGWKGGRAAVIALIGFSALTVDYYVVNLFIVGLHSYAKA